MPRSLLREFLHLEAAGGFLLLGAAVLALILANTPLEWLYDDLLETAVVVQVGALKLAKPLLLWINDGLMAVFFLLVGLEIKREVAEGELSSWHRAALPVVAAIGGIAGPAAIYLLINAGSSATVRGWAAGAACISAPDSTVDVRVIATDEEAMIASHTQTTIHRGGV